MHNSYRINRKRRTIRDGVDGSPILLQIRLNLVAEVKCHRDLRRRDVIGTVCTGKIVLAHKHLSRDHGFKTFGWRWAHIHLDVQAGVHPKSNPGVEATPNRLPRRSDQRTLVPLWVRWNHNTRIHHFN
jgi:hypothetical protein